MKRLTSASLVVGWSVAVAWWASAVRAAIQWPQGVVVERATVIFAFAGLQVVALLATTALSWRARGRLVGVAAVAALLLAFANLLYWLTPALGAPIVLLVALVAAVGLLDGRS